MFLTAWLALAAPFFMSGAAVAQDNLPDISLFTADPEITDVNLSPDGGFISAIVQNDAGQDMVLIIDIGTPENNRFISLGGAEVKWLVWAREDRLLAGVRASNGIAMTADRVLSFDRDGENQTIILDQSAGHPEFETGSNPVISRLPLDPDHVLMPWFEKDRLALRRVNVYDGSSEVITYGSVRTFSWIIDREGNPTLRLDWNTKKQQAEIFQYVPHQDFWSSIRKFRARDGQKAFDFWPLALHEDPDLYYIMARWDGDETYAVKLFDYQQNKVVETVSVRPGLDVEDVIATTSMDYVGAVYYDDLVSYAFKDPSLNKHMTALQSFFGETSNIFIADMSEDKNTLLLFVSGPQEPGAYFYYSIREAHVEPIAWVLPDINADALGQSDVISYTTRDGQRLKAYVTFPPDDRAGSGPYPLVVMPHGGPHARDYFDWSGRVQYLASRGFVIIQPQFRGSGGYGRAFEELGYGEWGGLMLDDIADSARFMIDKGIAETGNVCIVGGSYGGYAALTSAYKYSDLYTCAASINGVTDLDALYDRDKLMFPTDIWKHQRLSLLGPHTDRGRFRSDSPSSNIDRINMPVLVIYGPRDPRVYAYDHSIPFVEEMREAGKDVTGVRIDGGRHNFTARNDIEASWLALEDFLGRNLSGHSVVIETAEDKPEGLTTREAMSALRQATVEAGGHEEQPATTTTSPRDKSWWE